MSVNDIIEKQDEMKSHSYDFTLWPAGWGKFKLRYEWKSHKLEKSTTNNIPDQAGIYTLLIQPGIAGHPACSYLMYVGRTKSLRRRFRDYLNKEKLSSGRPKIFRLLNKYSDYLWFCYTIIETETLQNTEKELIEAYVPPCNDQIPAKIHKVIGAFK
jgi:excinuclease UvrABC nuclease subunit